MILRLQDMLADGPFSIGAHADQELLHGAVFNQLLKNTPQMIYLVTVHAAQVSIEVLLHHTSAETH